jgi:hypothetical protein
MIVVRNSFVAKPGQASKLAALLKGAAEVGGIGGYRVLTDMTGDFNTVILEYEAADMAAFEARMQEYATNAALREKMAGYTELWISGHRDVFKVM